MSDQVNTARRKFIGGAAGSVAVASIAPGIIFHEVAQARTPDQPATSENRWGMLIDTNKCSSGCDACVKGCQEEFNWGSSETESRPDQQAQWIRKVNLRDTQTGYAHSLPLMCQHCENPPCVDVCPTNASMKRADGIVLVDRHACIGCRYCMMACPYKARSFVHEDLQEQSVNAPRGKGCVESCTMCAHRVDEHGADAVPACAEACAAEGHDAFIFGDLNDPNSKLSQALAKHGATEIRADLGLNLGVRYWGI